MRNTYLIKGNEIVIEAPGNSNTNRIKNDLLWDINKFLDARYDLYTFYTCAHHEDSDYCLPITGFFDKYVAFRKLDNVFIQRTELSLDELKYYRAIMDPSGKMSDDVFKESCCVENVDMEYIATTDINYLLLCNRGIKTKAATKRWIISSVPIYISLFGAKEIKIIVNQNDIRDQIIKIVLSHCVEK